MAYLFIDILIGITGLIEIFRKKNSIFKILSIWVLILFIGLRNNVGYDYANYENMHKILASLNFKGMLAFNSAELGYILLNRIISNFTLLLLLIAIFNIEVKYIFLKKMSIYPYFSLFMYLSYGLLDLEFGKIRTAIATTFVIIAIYNLKNKQIKKYIFMIIIGSLFHKSLLLIILFYCIPNKILTRYKYICIFISCYILRIFSENIFLKITKNFDYIYNKLLYYAYLNQGNNYLFLGLNASLILRIIIFLYLLTNKNILDKFEKKLLNIYFVGICFYVIFSSIPELTRISNYYRIVEIILIPAILNKRRNKSLKIIVWSIFFGYLFWTTYKIIGSTPQWFLPYKYKSLMEII